MAKRMVKVSTPQKTKISLCGYYPPNCGSRTFSHKNQHIIIQGILQFWKQTTGQEKIWWSILQHAQYFLWKKSWWDHWEPLVFFFGPNRRIGLDVEKSSMFTKKSNVSSLRWFFFGLVWHLIELDDGKIYRKALYLMVKTMVSCRFSLKPIQWYTSWKLRYHIYHKWSQDRCCRTAADGVQRCCRPSELYLPESTVLSPVINQFFHQLKINKKSTRKIH